MVTKRQVPTVRLRRLAAELRRLRAVAELTQGDVAEATGINTATLYRIESAKVRPQRRTLMTLLELYQVPQLRRGEVLALLQDNGEQSWLRPYHADLRDGYIEYIGLEAEARAVWNYESLHVPGLLQTADYYRAVVRSVLHAADEDEIDRRVRVRLERYSVLVKDEPLQFRAVLDEAAIRRAVGGPEVMCDQLRHMVSAAALPNVTLQIIPFTAGAHAGMPGSFALLSFPEAEGPEIIYVDSRAGDIFIEAAEDLDRYGDTFDRLVSLALSPDESVSLIAEAAGEFGERAEGAA
ncbi:helix-turn-helix domain-containing protein [Kitasatospora sp. LaBMicrA B282]|uniref:helix-turn-helix domain-containing protein n=1 Tax=Kitasatospora sp. LaBMicrA B282 TaxID=3420949 RepID=UPI003D0E55CA